MAGTEPTAASQEAGAPAGTEPAPAGAEPAPASQEAAARMMMWQVYQPPEGIAELITGGMVYSSLQTQFAAWDTAESRAVLNVTIETHGEKLSQSLYRFGKGLFGVSHHVCLRRLHCLSNQADVAVKELSVLTPYTKRFIKYAVSSHHSMHEEGFWVASLEQGIRNITAMTFPDIVSRISVVLLLVTMLLTCMLSQLNLCCMHS